MTPDEIRTLAAKILLDHARDVEFLSISEHLEELDLPEDEHAAAQVSVDEAIRTARITVEWPEEASDR